MIPRELLRSAQTLTRNLAKGGKWQTQVSRIQEARWIAADLESASGVSASSPDDLHPTHCSLIHAIQTAVHQLYAELDARYESEVSKLQAATLSARAQKTAQRLADELADLCDSVPDLQRLRHLYAEPLSRFLVAARYADNRKTRREAAIAFERQGRKLAALDVYLELLFILRTDSIDDADQVEEITDLETRVRALVRSCYAGAPKKPRAPDSRPVWRPNS